MNTRTTKVSRKLVSPLGNLVVRREALKRMRGMWKDRYHDMIKENKKLRKEWDKRVNKLGW
jgi:hypothetical protein